MVRPIQQIETDLETLENQVSAIAQKIETAYQAYIELLGETLQNQLVFSVYQICTQEYPDGFLKLSLSEQQALQKQVRDLGKEAQANLKLGGDVLQRIEWNDEQAEALEEILSAEEQTTEETENTESQFNLSALQTLLNSGQQESEPDDKSPQKVREWCQLQAEAITMILENVSSEANEILRKTDILPQELPKEMIDAAVHSEGTGAMSNRSPGVVHLMLELERKHQQKSSQQEEEHEVIQLAIVRLRVGELEFAAPSLNTKRRALRNLEQQLQQLDEQYQNLARERAIAQAELAWRSSWHED
ncbi:MAG: hypothetical protein RI580_03420 [Halothece sp. Uz-M2-17]|nr:hypothetical protein [Halothece sp. Uz-M2-17]